MKHLPRALIALALFPAILHAQDAKAVRGGWVADVDGHTHLYMIIVRGETVTGTYCFDCADPRNLSFIQGQLTADGATFKVRHRDATGKVTIDEARGVVREGQMDLTVQLGRGVHTSVTLHRPAASPNVMAVTNDEAETRGMTGRGRPAYVLPGPPEMISAEKLPGVWLWGTGPGKQYFMIERIDGQLLGMVCGPCENPNNMAPLDGFIIDGTALTFNIVHEDTGAAVDHGPFNNVAHATLSHNELHLKVVPSYDPPASKPFEMTLLGPVQYQP